MPTPTKYTYNQNVANLDLLSEEIAASSIAQSADRIDRVAGSPDAIDVWYPDVLIAGDQTTLGTIMTDHDLTEAKLAKQTAINNYRDYKLFILPYTWPTDSNDYDMDAVSQFKISATLGYINAGNSLPEDFCWRCANNADHDFTEAQFLAFGKDAWDRAEAMHDVAKQHKDAVEALGTVAAVNSYNYTTETPTWPA